jgi:hypothetical protein
LTSRSWARATRLCWSRRPLAVVVELRLDALERVEQLVALVLERFELVRLDLLLVCPDFVGHYDVFASSSSMTS